MLALWMPMSNSGSTTPSLGTLYVVGTPIGNLEDFTFRAVRILQAVDAIASENTRHTAKLLQHYQIHTPQISFHLHNTKSRIPLLLKQLHLGHSLALVSDAGMPTISDPGQELVQACIENKIPVVTIPGPCAAITALVTSGLPTQRFCFEGFLPRKGITRQHRLAALKQECRTIILYESPHRLCQTLEDLAAQLGDKRPVVIAKELTKLHESLWIGTLAEAIATYQTQVPRGEFTLVLAGHTDPPSPPSSTTIKQELQHLISQGLSPSQASRQVAQHMGLPRRHVYQLSLQIQGNHEDRD